MKIRLVVRLYIAGKLDSEDSLDLPERELSPLIESFADRHVKKIAGRPFMVEFEFLDEPESTRFFRFGTDKRRMVQPAAVDLEKLL